jgi:16S rRNA (adenine1518-N6/adenine1519-N6)-dimethyltransferase
VLSFTPLACPRVEVGDEELFRRVVKGAFNQRRKTLMNTLRAAGFDAEEGWLKGALSRSGIDGGRRGETLSLEEFAALSRELLAGKTLA